MWFSSSTLLTGKSMWVLPDATASRILREFIIPRFRAQDYSGGIVAGIQAVLKVIRQEPLPQAARRSQRKETAFPPVVLFSIMLMSPQARRHNWRS